jgi:hypothetical protein
LPQKQAAILLEHLVLLALMLHLCVDSTCLADHGGTGSDHLLLNRKKYIMLANRIKDKKDNLEKFKNPPILKGLSIYLSKI